MSTKAIIKYVEQNELSDRIWRNILKIKRKLFCLYNKLNNARNNERQKFTKI